MMEASSPTADRSFHQNTQVRKSLTVVVAARSLERYCRHEHDIHLILVPYITNLVAKSSIPFVAHASIMLFVGYYVPFLSFVVLSYVLNALWLRRRLVSLSCVNCFRDNSLNHSSRGDR